MYLQSYSKLINSRLELVDSRTVHVHICTRHYQTWATQVKPPLFSEATIAEQL
jgi:hypothetical protein